MTFKYKNYGMKTACAAIALSLGFTGTVLAAPPSNTYNNYELDSDVPMTVGMQAHVQESVGITVTNMNFGVVGVHRDQHANGSSGTGVATLTMTPAGVLTDTHTQGADSRLIAEGATGASYVAPQAGEIALTGAFPNALIYEHYENIVDMTCASGPCTSGSTTFGTEDSSGSSSSGYSAPSFWITEVKDDLGTGGNGGTGAQTTGTYNGYSYTTASGDWVRTAGSSSPTPSSNTDGAGVTLSNGTMTWDFGATIATTPGSPYYASGTYTGSFDITLSY